MKKIITLIFFIAISIDFTFGQNSIDFAVRLTATVKETPPSITLHWVPFASTGGYNIYKKAKLAANFKFIKYLPSSDSSYTDNAVVADSSYEYWVSRPQGITTADGYIYAGIKFHATDYRGKLLLLVDSTFVDSLSTEVTNLMDDISADGWAVESHYVSRNATPPSVKAWIKSQYLADSLNVKALFLLGHIPVPYSGNFNPDAHPEHKGAWPADVYYGDIHGVYTDTSINNDTTAVFAYPSSLNVPGDGKFDQTLIPGKVLLQIGRVDLNNMDSFQNTEKELLQQYLRRDHDFRFKNFNTIARGIIQDDFGVLENYEAFASCGWRNFTPMFTDSGVHSGGYLSSVNAQNYLWSYGCGGGNNLGAAGIASSFDFAKDSVKTIFTMLFGSYFGDWNQENNFLRAPLASPGLTLTCAWAGRPYWFFHHMALGENIGYSTIITQNNSGNGPYHGSYAYNEVHVALMGDPTLRQHIIAPPQNVTFTTPGNGWGTSISWGNSADTGIAGYYIYRSTEKYGKYNRITSTILTASPFIDNPPTTGVYYYYVKAVKWEHTPSGNYLNTSEGVGSSVSELVSGVANNNPPNEKFMLYPNPASDNTLLVWQNVPAGQYSIIVKDELGRTVYSNNTNIRSSYYSMPLSLQGYSSGVYYVEAQNETNHFVLKLVVGK